MVSTHLKNISQNGNLPQMGVKIKIIWNHHPVLLYNLLFFCAFFRLWNFTSGSFTAIHARLREASTKKPRFFPWRNPGRLRLWDPYIIWAYYNHYRLGGRNPYTGCLVTESFFHGLWNKPPHNWGPYFIPDINPKERFGHVWALFSGRSVASSSIPVPLSAHDGGAFGFWRKA